MAHLKIGDNQLELDLEAELLRTLVTAATAALAEMDARFEQEEADQDAQERTAPAELSA